MKRTKKTLMTGLTVAVLGSALVTATAPVHANANLSSVAERLPTGPGMPVTPYWWVAAGAALLGGAVGGGAGGAAIGTPACAATGLAGAVAGGVGGLLGYAVTSLFGVASPDSLHLTTATVRALD
jgi:hypothetical protein